MIALLLPGPSSQLAMLADPRPDVVVGAMALLLSIAVTWLLVGWALVVCCAAAASRLPGSAGRSARRLLAVITPALFRRVVLTAAGVSVAAGLTACGPAPSAGPHAAPAAAVAATAAASSGEAAGGAAAVVASAAASGAVSDFSFDLDWPVSEPAGADTAHAAALQSPTAPSEPATTLPKPPVAGPSPTPRTADEPAAATAAPRQQPSTITVQRGDSLWSIAAEHLPAGAANAEVDAAWRAWYLANRDVIGADPNIVIPGQRLKAPAAAADPAPTAQESAR